MRLYTKKILQIKDEIEMRAAIAEFHRTMAQRPLTSDEERQRAEWIQLSKSEGVCQLGAESRRVSLHS